MSRKGYSGVRATRRVSLARTARTSRFNKNRSFTAKKATTTRNKRQIARIGRKLTTLRNNQYGHYQTQTSRIGPLNVVSNSPVALHINNCNSGAHGPTPHSIDLLGSVYATNDLFQIYQGEGAVMGDYQDDDVANMCNGPMMRLNWAIFDLKFSGFVDDCKIRIDIIRQKKYVADFWREDKSHQFLPNTLQSFKNLAGFTENRIDTSTFEIIKTKRLYLNSRGSQNVADLTQDRNTTEATTAPSRQCRIALRMNKVYKQLDSSIHQDSNAEVSNTGSAGLTNHPGSWRHTNLSPLANVWMIISCDDDRSLEDLVGGDNVSVEIIRRMTWQDKIS